MDVREGDSHTAISYAVCLSRNVHHDSLEIRWKVTEKMLRSTIIADPITEIRNFFCHMKRIEDVAVGGAETALDGFRRDQK